MPTWYQDNVEKFMPLQGYTIPWPSVGGVLKPGNYSHPGDAVPEMDTLAKIEGHDLDFIFNGKEYFDDLLNEMDDLIADPQGGIFWMHGWYFQLMDHDFILKFWGQAELPQPLQRFEPGPLWVTQHEDDELEVGPSDERFIEKLAEMHQAGVDVRIIGWVSPPMVKFSAAAKLGDGIDERNQATLLSLLGLRHLHVLPDANIIFNTLCHPLGGAHAKFVVLGNDDWRKVYTGGIDAAPSRNKADWPDVAVSVEGNAATQAGKFFIQLWNEITGQPAINIRFEAKDNTNDQVVITENDYPTHLGNQLTHTFNPVSTAITAPEARVQMYRTLPRKRYATGVTAYARQKLARMALGIIGNERNLTNADLAAIPQIPHLWTPPLSFAPDGCFEFKTVCYKAVGAAEKYIFIADQDATNFELMKCINKRIKELNRQGKKLRVIILTSILQEEEVQGVGQNAQPATKTFHQQKQLEMHAKLSAGLPDGGREHIFWGDYGTHAKVMIIDDKWLSIGSANCMRRSFYTDIEMGVAIMHETWVEDFRVAYWRTFLANNGVCPDDLDHAICIWGKRWLAPNVTLPTTMPKLDITIVQPVTLDPASTDGGFGYAQRRTQDPDSNDML